MKSLLIKKSLFAGSYFFVALLIEFITFNVMGIGLFPSYFWLDIAVLFLIAAILFIIPTFIAQGIAILVILLAQILVSIANVSLYSMSGLVFDLSMLNLMFELGGVFDNQFINIPFLVTMTLFLIAEAAILFSLRKYRAKHNFRFQTLIVLLFTFCLASGVSVTAYYLQTDGFTRASTDDEFYIYKDDSYLFDTQFLSAKAFRKFGSFGFYYKNIGNFLKTDPLFSGEVDEDVLEENLDALDEYFFSDEKWSDELDNLQLTEYGASDNILTGDFAGQNIVLIVIESGEWYAINRMYTPTLYALANQGIAMTQYYARDKTNHSEALSILGSYPSELENSITPSISNPQGLLDHNFSFSLPNILHENQYTTNYFHANSGTFYKRNETFGSLYGFDNAYFKDNMSRMKNYNKATDFYDMTRDSEVFSQYLNEFTTVNYLSGDETFFTMMMTLTTHGGYEDLVQYGDYNSDLTDKQKEELSKKYQLKDLEEYYERINGYPNAEDFIEGTPQITLSATDEEGTLTDVYLRYKRYQAAMMDLDVGVNRLIYDLQTAGTLENTTFIFYADHNSYYSGQQYALKGVENGIQWNTVLYNIPFFLWSGKCMSLNISDELYAGLEYKNEDVKDSIYSGKFYYALQHKPPEKDIGGVKLTKFCNTLDILPTILDLLGFRYNCNLYQGISVFDEPESVFVSRESGLFNDYIYTNGDLVYILAQEQQDGSWISKDGAVEIKEETVSILTKGEKRQYEAADVAEFIHVDEGVIVYNLDAIFETDDETLQDHRELLSDPVEEFLAKTSDYYTRQENIELMYAIDYFKYRDIDRYVKKAV